MKCEIISYVDPVDDSFNSVTSAARVCIKCQTHNMIDFAPYGYEDMLCPIGRVERAVEAGLVRIAEERAKLQPVTYVAPVIAADGSIMMTVFASQEDADAACLEFERAIVDVLAGQSNRIGD